MLPPSFYSPFKKKREINIGEKDEENVIIFKKGCIYFTPSISLAYCTESL